MQAIAILTVLCLIAGLPAAGLALTHEQWREDVDFACREMPKRHANLFHTLSPQEYQTACDRLRAEPAGTAEHRRVLALAALVARVGDGHTRLTLPMDPSAGLFLSHTATVQPEVAHFGHLPVRFEVLADGWLVVRATGEHRALLGSSVERIGGRPIEEVARALEPIVQRDNAAQVTNLLPMFAVVPEVLEARGVFATTQAAVLTVRHADGRTQDVEVRPVPPHTDPEWVDLVPDHGLPLHRGHPERNYWFTSLPGSRTMYFRFAEVIEQPHETIADFSRRLFQEIEDQGSERLVIDLRGNPGGNNDFNTPIVLGVIRAVRLWRPGGLFVITDHGTFSAAMNLANDLERWTPAVFAGSATGARPNSYGDARKLELPNSHLTVRLSSLYWQDSSPLDERDAITPILPVVATMADRRAGRDPVIEAILAFDAPAGAVHGAWRGELAAGYLRTPLSMRIAASERDLSASVDMPVLGVNAAPLSALEQRGVDLSGLLMIGKRRVPFAARVAGTQMAGWFEYIGERYPFVARRVE